MDHDGREFRNRNGDGNEVDLVTKRRRFGRFIGLRGCESPVDVDEKEDGHGNENGNDQGEEMVRRMEMEWQMALERAVGEDPGAVVRSKWW